jgi:hypothetical protein
MTCFNTFTTGEALDTKLLETLLHAPGINPAVFGSPVLKAIINFKCDSNAG